MVLRAVINEPQALKYHRVTNDGRFRLGTNHQELVLAAAQRNGLILEILVLLDAVDLISNPAIILAAVIQSGRALKFVPREILRADPNLERSVILAAVSSWGYALELAGHLRKDREVGCLFFVPPCPQVSISQNFLHQ